jgi:hypothetical protein
MEMTMRKETRVEKALREACELALKTAEAYCAKYAACDDICATIEPLQNALALAERLRRRSDG